VEPEITPDPSPEEREAILVALEAVLGPLRSPAARRGEWWSDGVRENLDDGATEYDE